MSAKSAKAWRIRQKDNYLKLKQLEIANSMNNALLERQRDKIDRLEAVIADAVSTAGHMSILFPAETVKSHHESRSVWDVPIFDRAPYPNNFSESSTINIQRLRVLLAEIKHSAFSQTNHCLINFGDQKWGYAISDQAIRSMRKDVAVKFISEALGKVIGAEIK